MRGFLILYQIIGLLTVVYLTFFDGNNYTALNWLIAVPVNFFLGEIWPLYWGLLRWVI